MTAILNRVTCGTDISQELAYEMNVYCICIGMYIRGLVTYFYLQ